MTILIIDDNSVNRKLVSALLLARGYEVLVATDGPTALTVAEQQQVDAILLDVILPTMDGFEVCRRLKRNPVTASIPVILMSTLKEETVRWQSIEVGADSFIPKPLQKLDLLLAIQRVIRSGRHPNES